MRKVRLGFLVALVAVLSVAGSARAGTPEASNGMDLADYDIYRTGIPDYDLVWQFYTEFDIGSLEHMPRAGVPRPDGYYWVIVRQEERDVIDEMVEELRRIMGDDFPIAVSVSSPAPIIDEATARALKDKRDKLIERDIYRTGSPDLKLVKEFHEEFDSEKFEKHLTYAQGNPPLIVGAGVRIDGYYCVSIREENWDAIYETVKEIQQITGEDLPIAVNVQNIRPLGDVFGGHRCTIQRHLSYDRQTLGFAAVSAGEVGMVLSGHWLGGSMPVGSWVYSPTSWFPLLTNRIGIIDRVGGVYSDSSYMRPAWPGSGRIKAGVLYYGSHMPVWGWEDSEIGDYVFKTGRTTGITLGEVYWIHRVWAGHHGRYLENQVFATNYAAPGGSGSPVYWIEVIQYPIPNGWPPAGPEFAILKGVLWAGSEDPADQFMVFSTMTQVMDDLDVWPLPGPF